MTHPLDALVDAATLREHLDDRAWLIVDCRHELSDFGAGARAYALEHILGARFARAEDDLSGVKTGTNGRHPLPTQHAFAAFLELLGANDETQLVAYDAGADMFAARFWFLCRWIGHAAVAILDGGLAAWKAAGYPVTDELPASRGQGRVHVREPLVGTLDASAVRRTLDGARRTPDGARLTLLDARAPDRYVGAIEPIDPVAGHIPGACNRFFKLNYDESGRWKTPERLREDFAAYGDPANVVNYCGSGVSAAANLFAMHVAGLEGARVYPGSWSEWCADPAAPVERG